MRHYTVAGVPAQPQYGAHVKPAVAQAPPPEKRLCVTRILGHKPQAVPPGVPDGAVLFPPAQGVVRT